MKIFLVSVGQYSDYRIVGGFSTKERAEAFINTPALREIQGAHPQAELLSDRGSWLHSKDHDLRIEEIDVDALGPTKWIFKTWEEHYPTCSNRDNCAGFIGTASTFHEEEDE